MNLRTAATVVGPALVLGTMAVGLRLGAEPAGAAVHVLAMPVAHARDRLVIQLRAIREQRRIQEPAPGMTLEAVARKGHETARWSGRANEEGIAEADFALPNLATGDAVEIEIRSDATVLASGTLSIPAARASRPADPVRATKTTGNIGLSVFAPPGGVAPQLENLLWLRVDAASETPRDAVRLAAEGEAGLEVVGAPGPICPAGFAPLRVRPMGLTLGLHASATDKAGAKSTWYGGIPVSFGGDEIAIDPPVPSEGAPFVVRIRNPTMKPFVYVEIFDDIGREHASSATLTRAASGYGEASVVVRALPSGRHFAIVSSRPDGFALGSAVARGFRIGKEPATSCDDEVDLATRVPPEFVRATSLDGFGLRREEAARTRRKGTVLAVAALATGGLLAVAMLFASLRKAAPPLDLDEASAEAITKSTTPRWLAVAILVALSCLAYFLLAGLVLYGGS